MYANGIYVCVCVNTYKYAYTYTHKYTHTYNYQGFGRIQGVREKLVQAVYLPIKSRRKGALQYAGHSDNSFIFSTFIIL